METKFLGRTHSCDWVMKQSDLQQCGAFLVEVESYDGLQPSGHLTGAAPTGAPGENSTEGSVVIADVLLVNFLTNARSLGFL